MVWKEAQQMGCTHPINAKSPLQRAFPGFPYNLLVVVGDKYEVFPHI
jgi:hypothetical protein